MSISAFALILSVSCYAPASGDGISGGMTTASGERVSNRIAACPAYLRFGTTIDVGGIHPDGSTSRVICGDRFGAQFTNGYYLDLAIAPATDNESASDKRARHAACMRFGRQTRAVTVYPPPADFRFRWGRNSLQSVNVYAVDISPKRIHFLGKNRHIQ